MNKLRTLIVDDEKVSRQLLRSVLQTHQRVDVVGESDNGMDAISTIESIRPDLVMLDIQMPNVDGFQVVEAIAPELRPAIIFVTAFDHYAVKAFRIHAIDYLLKPVDDQRLLESVDRTIARQGTNDWASALERLDQLVDARRKPDFGAQWFFAKSGDQRVPVRWQQVEWMESAQNYVKAHVQGKTFLIRATLQSLEKQLQCHGFVRVHRSRIVNVEMIRSLSAVGHGDFEIELNSGQFVTLSRRYRERFEAMMGDLG